MACGLACLRGKWSPKKILAMTSLSLAVITILLVSVFFWLLLHRTPGQTFDSNGVPVFYTVEGEGEPVILIHGLAAQSDWNWRYPGVTRMLAKDFQVISMDIRGHGLTGKPTAPEAYGMEMIEDVVRLMDHLGLPSAHVAGYSLGGFIALKLAVTHPERVRSVAYCASGWAEVASLDEIPNPYRKPVPPGETAMKSRAEEKAAEADSSRKNGNNKSLFHRIRSSFGDRVINPDAKRALKKTFTGFAVPREALQHNQVPSVCFIGTNDGLFYMAEELRKNMANLEYVVIEGANHFTTPFYGEFKRGLRDFLLRHREQ